MKKTILVLIIALLMLPAALEAIQVDPPSGPYFVGQEILFRASSYDYNFHPGVINYGDGSSDTNVTEAYWKTHVYRSPGRYVVTLQPPAYPSQGRLRTISGTPPPPESMTITIRENRSIQVSPASPVVGQATTFTAVNFNTPDNIRWEMGDGTVYRHQGAASPRGGSVVTHTYAQAGSYQVRAYDWNGSLQVTAVSVQVNIGQPNRAIQFSPASPREDQPVYFEAVNFLQPTSIHWNFGDGTREVNGSQIMHRFQQAGTRTVSAVDGTLSHPPVSTSITVLPENRFITVSAPEVLMNRPVSVAAQNFRGDLVLWNFGDGVQESGGHEVTHTYAQSGTFTISARDENGESTRQFTATVTVRGIDDEVLVDVAEIRLDNGKYYKVVPRKSRALYAVLRMKMRGTGIVSGQWIVDGQPYEFFNELAIQGELKEIRTRELPGLPVLDPGLHTITLELTRPNQLNVVFPVLKYFVLPYENLVELATPLNEFVAKEKEIPEFSWLRAPGASRYEVAFSSNLYAILYNTPDQPWHDAGTEPSFTPTPPIWNQLRRNRWSYWKVRALDSAGQVVAESDVREFKAIVATAEITLNRVTDLEGREVDLSNGVVSSRSDHLLVQGNLKYAADTEFLVMRIYTDEIMTDQLVFRNVQKDRELRFETSVPHNGDSRVLFQLLKTSSPAVVVGLQNLRLKR
ncbi:MAG TPA: PKD domain-containing protein [Candidatus Aminicenantes bacterium]|nr:PKD domain-containing protein [Candidatus Aminicenantes bacterium]